MDNYGLIDDITDVSGAILFASIYNTFIPKSKLDILDQIVDDDTNRIIDITLMPKQIDYNTFRQSFYPTNNKQYLTSVLNQNLLKFSTWMVDTSDGIHPFIFYDFVISAIEQYLGVSRINFNPTLRISLEKQLINTDDIRSFNKNGTQYALSWNEIVSLLEQIGVIFNKDEDDSTLLTLVLNYSTPLVKDFSVRIFLPFVVTGIYKGWDQSSKLSSVLN